MDSPRIRVFLVDDSSLVRSMLTKGLSLDQSLHIVGAATDGQEALEQLASVDTPVQADVIVSDMDMPTMNGLEFIKCLKSGHYGTSRLHRTPIILLSSWTQADKRITEEAMEVGAADFIPKPSAIDPNGFQTTLNRLIAKIKAVAGMKASVMPVLSTPPQGQTPRPISVGIPMQQAHRRPTTNFTQRSNHLVVGIGEFAVTGTQGTVIKVFALGSCIALTLFAPNAGVVGMAHIALPSSTIAPEKALLLPGYYADTALPAMLKAFREAGYAQPASTLVAKIVGGATTAADTQRHFNIGERNYRAVRGILQEQGIYIVAEQTGGDKSRTAWIQAGSSVLAIALDTKNVQTI
jgi:chemotaxis protein CheD